MLQNKRFSNDLERPVVTEIKFLQSRIFRIYIKTLCAVISGRSHPWATRRRVKRPDESSPNVLILSPSDILFTILSIVVPTVDHGLTLLRQLTVRESATSRAPF